MRHRRKRSTWFPILGFDTTGAGAVGLSTVDSRELTVSPIGEPNISIIPIIPDIDIPPEQSQTAGGTVQNTLRDFVEGQSCIIDRITGVCCWGVERNDNSGAVGDVIVCTAIAVVPTADDGTGNPAVGADELDPLRADNAAQPWYWRRVWVLSNNGNNDGGGLTNPSGQFPTNNIYGSSVDGPKIDTNGVKRAIRREERIFLIHSVLAAFPVVTSPVIVHAHVDLRVIGHMVKAKNRSAFK